MGSVIYKRVSFSMMSDSETTNVVNGATFLWDKGGKTGDDNKNVDKIGQHLFI